MRANSGLTQLGLVLGIFLELTGSTLAMDEAHQILVNGLEQAGVVMPTGVSTIQDVGSGSLVSICSQVLRLVNEGSSFSTSLPVSMAEQFRLCTDLANAIKQLGYRGDLSFHQFLYPSEEGTYQLLRFMLERLSKSSLSSRGRSRGHRKGFRGAAVGRFTGEDANSRTATATTVKSALSRCLNESDQGQNQEEVFPFRTCPLRLANASNQSKKTPALITLQAKPKDWLCSSVLEFNAKRTAGTSKHLDDATEEPVGARVVSHGFLEPNDNSPSAHEMAFTEGYLLRLAKFSGEKDLTKYLQAYRTKKEESHGKESGENDANSARSGDHENGNYIPGLEEKLAVVTMKASQMEAELAELQNQEVLLKKKLDAKQLETQMLDEESLLFKAAVDMALDSKRPGEFYLEELGKRVEARKQQITALELQWDTVRMSLEEKKESLGNLLHSRKCKDQDKIEELQAVEQEIKRMTAKIHEREEEEVTLSLELENAPKVATRNTYIQRITELIKNSKKQDADIARIIHDTQQLQRESNATQDRLHRTYAIVDEIVFRDAKKDPVCRQVYRLLTSIHQNFSETFEKVFSIDKVHREIAEYEAKLEAMQRSHLDVSKVQVDLDTIWKENELLEKQLQK